MHYVAREMRDSSDSKVDIRLPADLMGRVDAVAKRMKVHPEDIVRMAIARRLDELTSRENGAVDAPSGGDVPPGLVGEKQKLT